MADSIRYDLSLGGRLLRAIPVIAFYVAIVLVLFLLIPERIRNGGSELPMKGIVALGLIGSWRYLWLMTHVVRSAVYEHFTYPRLRFKADELSEEDKFEGRVYFVIPTVGEKPEVSKKMLHSVLDELDGVPVDATLVFNTGGEDDDEIFRKMLAERNVEGIEVIYTRQQGGKRQGMADVLYLLADRDIDEADKIILMDGDTVLAGNVLQKCLPLFKLKPKLGAVTTDNIAVTAGNFLYRKWYTLRFAMRHRMMKSQSLASQLLVLTGRLSIFRAHTILDDEFISHLENDRIKHWLHGEIKFVTGDDKSTWFCLLKRGAEMLYVPDAHIYCMEDSGKQPLRGSVKKMHRWFGNMLRNNGRAIRLGLGSQRLFTWWSLIDQRISMWTSLLGPASAIWAAVFISPYALLLYAIIVIFVRLIYLLLLSLEGHRLSVWDIPMLLYTQWVGSMVKIYTMFHLHRQKWDAHRRGADEEEAPAEPFMLQVVPKMQIAFSCMIMLMFVAMLIGVN